MYQGHVSLAAGTRQSALWGLRNCDECDGGLPWSVQLARHPASRQACLRASNACNRSADLQRSGFITTVTGFCAVWGRLCMPQVADVLRGPSALELCCAVFRAAGDAFMYAMHQLDLDGSCRVMAQINDPAFRDMMRQVSEAWHRSLWLCAHPAFCRDLRGRAKPRGVRSMACRWTCVQGRMRRAVQAFAGGPFR